MTDGRPKLGVDGGNVVRLKFRDPFRRASFVVTFSTGYAPLQAG